MRGPTLACKAMARGRGQGHGQGRSGAVARHVQPETRVTRWLAALPEGAPIAWSEDTIPSEARVTRGWLDVRVPELCESAGLGWVWSVEGPDLPDPGSGALTLAVPYDAHVDLTLRGGGVVSAVLERGDGSRTPIPAEEVAHWAASAVLHAAEGEDEIRRTPVWTPEAVSQAIRVWCADHAGRDDLVVSWDEAAAPSPLIRELEQISQRLEAEGLPEDAVLLGEGLFALPDAFGELLAMGPEEAAKVTGALAQAIPPHTGT